MASTTINRGNISLTILVSLSLTPTSVPSASVAEQSFPVPGLQMGDQVSAVQLQAAWTGLTSIVGSRVSAANTLAISFQNGTGGALTPPAGTYLLEVNRAESLPLPTNAS
jgi:hypothetical protein